MSYSSAGKGGSNLCARTRAICPNWCRFAPAFHQSKLQKSSAPGLPCSSPRMQSQGKQKENEAAVSRIPEPAGVPLSPWFCKKPAKKRSQGFYSSTRSLASFFFFFLFREQRAVFQGPLLNVLPLINVLGRWPFNLFPASIY